MIKFRQVKKPKENVIDFFIAASGFESRAPHQAKFFSSIARIKIALGFKNEKDNNDRKLNDSYFLENGFTLKILDEEEATHSFLDTIIHQISQCDDPVIYLDYSCMTKNWYSYILYGLNELSSSKNFKIYFGYSHAKFVKNEGPNSLNRIVSPLFGYCDLSLPTKPTALIIGMGNEPNRIYGLKEYFDTVPYLFYTDESYNKDYGQEIESLNHAVIQEVGPEHTFKFPIHDLNFTEHLLSNLSNSLNEEYRVVIAPCGPKPFALLAMIISLQNPNSVEVWRISPGVKVPKVNREATGLISIIELVFS